jgi:hypothetical protein
MQLIELGPRRLSPSGSNNLLKHFKEGKRNELFPEIVVGTVDITLKRFPRVNYNTQY